MMDDYCRIQNTKYRLDLKLSLKNVLCFHKHRVGLQMTITATGKPPFLILFIPLREDMVRFLPVAWEPGRA